MTANNLAISTYWAVIDRPYSGKHRLVRGLPLRGTVKPAKSDVLILPLEKEESRPRSASDRAKPREKAQGSFSDFLRKGSTGQNRTADREPCWATVPAQGRCSVEPSLLF